MSTELGTGWKRWLNGTASQKDLCLSGPLHKRLPPSNLRAAIKCQTWLETREQILKTSLTYLGEFPHQVAGAGAMDEEIAAAIERELDELEKEKEDKEDKEDEEEKQQDESSTNCDDDLEEEQQERSSSPTVSRSESTSTETGPAPDGEEDRQDGNSSSSRTESTSTTTTATVGRSEEDKGEESREGEPPSEMMVDQEMESDASQVERTVKDLVDRVSVISEEEERDKSKVDESTKNEEVQEEEEEEEERRGKGIDSGAEADVSDSNSRATESGRSSPDLLRPNYDQALKELAVIEQNSRRQLDEPSAKAKGKQALFTSCKL